MSTVATLGPAVSALDPQPAPLAGASPATVQIPVHRLGGAARAWADRLLGVFNRSAFDGIEWSMKFTADGLVGDRFLLALSREHWFRLEGVDLARVLAIPPDLWGFIQSDMQRAQVAYFSYEPDEGAGIYRMYLEILPTDPALQAAGSLPLGRGYKWDPVRGERFAVTDYQMRYLESPQAFDDYVQPYLARLSAQPMQSLARRVLDAACEQADPCRFMFLEATESDTRRDSFSVTFRGAQLPLKRFVPDLLQLATALALPSQQVLDHLVPDEPRSLCSLAAGVTRRGQDFLTVYYD
ncbi:hypothetical protein CDEF62S_00723 [Castellaniella defragrans]